jgi:hypothetical protein
MSELGHLIVETKNLMSLDRIAKVSKVVTI